MGMRAREKSIGKERGRSGRRTGGREWFMGGNSPPFIGRLKGVGGREDGYSIGEWLTERTPSFPGDASQTAIALEGDQQTHFKPSKELEEALHQPLAAK